MTGHTHTFELPVLDYNRLLVSTWLRPETVKTLRSYCVILW